VLGLAAVLLLAVLLTPDTEPAQRRLRTSDGSDRYDRA